LHVIGLASGRSGDVRPTLYHIPPGRLHQAVGLTVEAIDQSHVARFGGEAAHGLDQAVDRMVRERRVGALALCLLLAKTYDQLGPVVGKVVAEGGAAQLLELALLARPVGVTVDQQLQPPLKRF